MTTRPFLGTLERFNFRFTFSPGIFMVMRINLSSDSWLTTKIKKKINFQWIDWAAVKWILTCVGLFDLLIGLGRRASNKTAAAAAMATSARRRVVVGFFDRGSGTGASNRLDERGGGSGGGCGGRVVWRRLVRRQWCRRLLVRAHLYVYSLISYKVVNQNTLQSELLLILNRKK